MHEPDPAGPRASVLSKAGLFARLAATSDVKRDAPGDARSAARACVVTPNRRLAQSLAQQFDALQLSAGRSVWPAPDILPFSAFVEREWDDALHAGLPEAQGTQTALLLGPAQAQALWEAIVGRNEDTGALLAVAQAAASACAAWQTAHAWRIAALPPAAALNEDAEVYARWARRYERATRERNCIDAARLPDRLAAVLADARAAKPALLVRYGFDILTPQQAALFGAYGDNGCEVAVCEPQPVDGRVARLACADANDEMARAARWARARLEENAQARIGVVVPDLAARRNALRRIFTQTLRPAARLAGAAPTVLPFNISLAEPLIARPLVDAAFLVLGLAGREIDFESASRLVRSPFIAASGAELARRAQLDAALRGRAEPVLTLERLNALLDDQAALARAPVLAQKLTALAAFRRERLFGAQAPSRWGRAFSDALSLVGFPGERTLDSVEYQTLKKWHEALAGFARLDAVVEKMGFGEALAHLRRIAADTAFQPESPEVPIQVLGMLESAGCEFDHLWVMGLSAEAWPLAARANPFLPIAQQRAAGIPEASAVTSLELDRRITQGWRTAAPEVVFSHPLREADRELLPSPLIAKLPLGALDLPAYPDLRAALFASRRMEAFDDAVAPPLATQTAANGLHGGAQIFKDQAACQFRAFARHRLDAQSLEAPHAGLDAMERGTLVHRVLAAVWAELGTKQALDGIAALALRGLIERAAATAVERAQRERPGALGGRFAQVERERLARLALDWLDTERGRGDFSVAAIEDKRAIGIGGLRFNARLDRVDETAEGRRIVIDYKTGASVAGDWLGERPAEPQLPLYLLAAEPQAKAIAFAQVRAGDMKFVALAAGDGILPGARTLPDGRLGRAADSWEAQLEAWRAELERLAHGFSSGAAGVDPKPRACDYCDLKPLCRIHEREAGLAENAGDKAGDPAGKSA